MELLHLTMGMLSVFVTFAKLVLAANCVQRLLLGNKQ